MILFDFDGVLVDSLNEVALTAYNAATGSLLTSLSEIPDAPIALFKRNRFHVQQIGDAITLMNWCIEKQHFDTLGTLSKDEYRTVASGDTASLSCEVGGAMPPTAAASRHVCSEDVQDSFFATHKRLFARSSVYQ